MRPKFLKLDFGDGLFSMDYSPLSGREFPRFSAIKTFFRLPYVDIASDYDVGIFGVPFDGGVSFRPGARFGPSQVRELSSLGRGFHETHEWNLFKMLKIADIGDCPTTPIDLNTSYNKIESFASKVLDQNKKFVAVGGDHSITLPLLRAVHKKYKTPLNLIHFDAHLDTYPAAWDQEYHHGSFARHAVEEGLVNPQKMIQIGIRGPFSGKDDLDFAKKHSIKILTAEGLKTRNLEITELNKISQWSGPTYITFDIDAIDPAYAPGTGTPVPGGLTSFEALTILRHLKPIQNLVGADLVEISPAYDPAQITSLLGTSILIEILNLMIKS